MRPLNEGQRKILEERAEVKRKNQALIRELRAEGLSTIQIANKIHASPSVILKTEKDDPLARR